METLTQKSTLTFYEQIIINSIDLEPYGLDNDQYIYDKIKTVYNIFKQEYLFPANLKRYRTEKNCFKEWLMGLPSVLTVPFYNCEILELGKKYGYNLHSESSEDDFLSNYWYLLSNAFFTLKNNL